MPFLFLFPEIPVLVGKMEVDKSQDLRLYLRVQPTQGFGHNSLPGYNEQQKNDLIRKSSGEKSHSSGYRD